MPDPTTWLAVLSLRHAGAAARRAPSRRPAGRAPDHGAAGRAQWRHLRVRLFPRRPDAGDWGGDGVRLWDTASGQLKATLQAGSVVTLAFSPDGKTLATASDQFGVPTVEVWGGASGPPKETPKAGGPLAVSPPRHTPPAERCDTA